MSSITDLIERMSVIPGKRKRTNELGVMLTYRDKLKASADEADCVRSLNTALERIETGLAEKSKQGVADAASAASKLKVKIQGGAGFDPKRADAALIIINDKLGAARSGTNKGWRVLVDDQTKRFAPLAEAAKSASLPGAAGLNAAIAELQGWRDKPPMSVEEADHYVAVAASIPKAISELGLQGRPGDFMIAASKGQAKAKDLQDPEILRFLDANPAIWTMLKVGI